MRAAVIREFGRPLSLEERDEPSPGPGEVVLEVRAVGLCGTDLKIASGTYPGTRLPLVPGHEVAGVVVIGSRERPPGTRVACYIYDPCGGCRWCRAGQDTLCAASRRIGFDLDGGLALRLRVRADNTFPFADWLDFGAAAVAMDAVTTVWRAIRVRGALADGELLVIAGAGGLGLNAVQVAAGSGARVAVIDPVPERRLAALAAGAEIAVGSDEAGAILEWSEGGADLGVEASGVRAGFDALSASVRAGGRLVCVGYRPGVEYGLDSHQLVRRELTLLGSRNGAREDARQALAAVEAGSVKPAIAARFPLAEVNLAYRALGDGQLPGRVLVEPQR
jgi:D-arabinose 1-dehydrogenase-like Zn-dependent alcohol dehydrogenase